MVSPRPADDDVDNGRLGGEKVLQGHDLAPNRPSVSRRKAVAVDIVDATTPIARKSDSVYTGEQIVEPESIKSDSSDGGGDNGSSERQSGEEDQASARRLSGPTKRGGIGISQDRLTRAEESTMQSQGYRDGKGD